ncbi:MAG: hypothetical protein AABY22_01395, partial [Nanoarchaeota archaeon]
MSNIEFFCGADPEIAMKSGNSLIYSRDYLYHNNNLYPEDHVDDEFGSDGYGKAFELRPAPSKCPLELVKNMHGILKRKVKKDKKILNFNWKTGSYVIPNCPLGGHVHFGVRNYKYLESFIHLDQYLGLPLILLEDKDEARKRRVYSKYGQASDIRENEHREPHERPDVGGVVAGLA